MIRRIERDIAPQVDITNDSHYKNQINQKKRRFAEAFPDALDSSIESSSSSENNIAPTGGNTGTQSRKKRIINEMRELSENVVEYEESI